MPQNLSAIATGDTTVVLTWDSSTDNAQGCGLEGYLVFRNGAVVGSPGQTTFSDSGLFPSTDYLYRVSAVDSSEPPNESNWSDPATVTTLASADTTAPDTTAFAGGTATSDTETMIVWEPADDNPGGSGVSHYLVYRDGQLLGKANYEPDPYFTTNSIRYGDTGLTPSTSYDYTIVTVDNAGNRSTPYGPLTLTTMAAPDTTAPSVPSGLATTTMSSSRIDLSWTASTDTGGSGFEGYNIYRDGNKIAYAPINSYQDDVGLEPSTTYTYEVTAIDHAGNESAKSSSATGTTNPPPADNIPPSAPSGVVAQPVSTTQINLSWNASSDLGGAGMDHYNVYRDGIQVGSTSKTSYPDSGLSISTYYEYYVEAVDGNSNVSDPSPTSGATTLGYGDTTAPPAPDPVELYSLATDEICIGWPHTEDQGGSGRGGYKIFKDGGNVNFRVSAIK